MLKKCNALFFLFILITFQAIAQNDDSVNEFIPNGWKLISKQFGDLNKDGVNDAILVLEDTKAENFKKNDGLGPAILNINPRRLLILFKNASGYKEEFKRDDIIPSKGNDSFPCLADPLENGGVSTTRGLLIIELGTWLSCGGYGVTHEKFSIRYEKSIFRLIGYDYYSFSRSTGEASELSVNYLSGKKISTIGLNEFEDSNPKTTRSKFPNSKLFDLAKISLTCSSNEETPCDWYQGY